ncbi:hypothetical protein BJY04DRAFT_190648 [Aspergillus karnatakaensis]|uniref:coiled-coil-helix-coiled-coil-helix domain-containing protein n=1 Tax=Aspergillus karnatakaensis TaxID=1810916 RepID=UPI003CCE36D0
MFVLPGMGMLTGGLCRDKRIFSTGCSVEQDKLNECYWAKKDWRACKKEMDLFRACWKKQGNDVRTQSKDA